MTAPGCHAVRITPLSWQKTRAAVYLGLLLYALGWTVQRWNLRLRAALPRRPKTRPATPDAVPEGPAFPLAGRGAAPVAVPRPGRAAPLIVIDGVLDESVSRAIGSALHALDDVARTRDDLQVIHAGGMLLPDRPRENPDPEPFRVPAYYQAWEREQAARRWLR